MYIQLSSSQRKFLRELLKLYIDTNPCKRTASGYACGRYLFPHDVVKPLLDAGVVVTEENYWGETVLVENDPVQARRVLRTGEV